MRTITLTSGDDCFIDDEDYDELIQSTWHLMRTCYDKYAYRWNPYPKAELMHRVIMKADREIVDHWNSDGLDNRRENLRLVTYSENNHNARKLAPATSKHKGVHWESSRKKWKAMIMVDGRHIFLGRFDSETDAAFEYEKAKQLYFG